MWEDNSTEWMHFRQDVMAADQTAACVLMRFLRTVDRKRLYTAALEVLDLQRYRVIHRPSKVAAALRNRMHLPFIFAVGRN